MTDLKEVELQSEGGRHIRGNGSRSPIMSMERTFSAYGWERPGSLCLKTKHIIKWSQSSPNRAGVMFRKMYSVQGLILTFQGKRSSNECLLNGPNSTRTPRFSSAKGHRGVCFIDLLTLGPIGDFFYTLWLCGKNENIARQTSLLSIIKLSLKDFLTCLAGYSLALFFFWVVRWLFYRWCINWGNRQGQLPV